MSKFSSINNIKLIRFIEANAFIERTRDNHNMHFLIPY